LKSKRGKPLKMRILYEDPNVIGLYKPAGLLTQSDITGDPDLLTMTRSLLKDRESTSKKNLYLGMIHRLDKPVAGVIVFAKSPSTAASLNRQFKSRSVNKTYFAVTHGRPPDQGRFTDYLKKEDRKSQIAEERDKGSKFADLTYRVLESRNDRSLMEIELITGRSHQIRVQFASRGFPIVADRKYGSKEVLKDPGMIALCAFSLRFKHPLTKKTIRLYSARPPHWPWYDPTLFKSR